MDTPRAVSQHHRRGQRLRLGATVVMIVSAYYLVPVFEPVGEAPTVLRAGATAVALGLAAWFVARQVARGARATATAVRVDRLVLALVIGIVVFALADFTVATVGDDQFVGLETRTDALYFTLTTLLTVGFGDVHAAGQLARALVSIQMVFNVLVLATAGQILWRNLAERRSDG